MNCPLCKGEMLKGYTILPFGKSEYLLVVKDVPALICEQCGESYVDINTVRVVEKIIANAEKSGITLGYINYKNAA